MKTEVGVRWEVTWWEPEATNRKGGKDIGGEEETSVSWGSVSGGERHWAIKGQDNRRSKSRNKWTTGEAQRWTAEGVRGHKRIMM